MRQILSITALLFLLLTSCEKYKDYSFEEYDYSTVYFPTQELSRTAVSGESLSIKVGIYLGGYRDNPQHQEVGFEIQDTMPTGYTQYTVLPSSYYTFSNTSTISIEKGSLQGLVDVSFNEEMFFNDSKCLEHHYALHLRLTDSGGGIDSILAPKDFVVLPIKYINTYEGNYYTYGVVKEFNVAGDTLLSAIGYGDEVDHTTFQTKALSTVSHDSVLVVGVGDRTDKNDLLTLLVNDDNSVEVISVAGSNYSVEPNGVSSWDPISRKFKLSYKYTNDGKLYTVEEYLVFRNRVRDGINEWRWDGFEGN